MELAAASALDPLVELDRGGGLAALVNVHRTTSHI
jgi:hypothetical protein